MLLHWLGSGIGLGVGTGVGTGVGVGVGVAVGTGVAIGVEEGAPLQALSFAMTKRRIATSTMMKINSL